MIEIGGECRRQMQLLDMIFPIAKNKMASLVALTIIRLQIANGFCGSMEIFDCNFFFVYLDYIRQLKNLKKNNTKFLHQLLRIFLRWKLNICKNNFIS